MPKYIPPVEKVTKSSKPSAGVYGNASSDRPYSCPYEGCEKSYIHEYKLKLHLRREHPGHISDEPAENAPPNIDNEADEGSDQDAYVSKRGNDKSQKASKAKSSLKTPASKVTQQRKVSTPAPANLNVIKKQWPIKEEIYEEEDSEETEEDRDNVEEGWRYAENNEDDDEETEYED